MKLRSLVVVIAWLTCVLSDVGGAHAQLFRRSSGYNQSSSGWGSYQMCGNTSCGMCYGNTSHYTGNDSRYLTNYTQQNNIMLGKPPRDNAIASTPQELVEIALALAVLGPDDLVYDPGCGDGRVLKTAWKKWKARGIGIEIDYDIAAEAKDNCKGLPITIVNDDARSYTKVYKRATVVYMHLYTPLMEELVPKMQGVRVIVSYNHPIPFLKNRKIKHKDHTIYLAYPTKPLKEWKELAVR